MRLPIHPLVLESGVPVCQAACPYHSLECTGHRRKAMHHCNESGEPVLLKMAHEYCSPRIVAMAKIVARVERIIAEAGSDDTGSRVSPDSRGK